MGEARQRCPSAKILAHVLQGETPASLLDTEVGGEPFTDTLCRIEQGVFARHRTPRQAEYEKWQATLPP